MEHKVAPLGPVKPGMFTGSPMQNNGPHSVTLTTPMTMLAPLPPPANANAGAGLATPAVSTNTTPSPAAAGGSAVTPPSHVNPPRRTSLGTPLTPQMRVQLEQIEKAAEIVYISTDQIERKNAQHALRAFTQSPECIPQCQLILDHSKVPYALILASSSLVKLTTTYWNSYSPLQTVEIRNYVLNYLGLNLLSLHPVVVTNLVQLVARITKLGWHDDPQHQEIVSAVTKFLTLSVKHCILGFKILSELVNQMNEASPLKLSELLGVTAQEGQSLTSHRKTAVSFRDRSLLYIFKLALTNLRQILNKQINVADESEDDMLKNVVLELALRCLNFDFIGTNTDEASEDVGTIQIPDSWHALFEDPQILPMFFKLFVSLKPPRSAQCMEVLVQLASCRRTVFRSDESRNLFVTNLCVGTKDLLMNHRAALESDLDCYHHFCRLLGRLKANYQLKELINIPGYSEWIEIVAQFTIHSFQIWEKVSNSVHYLIGLWDRITTAVPYMKTSPQSNTPAFLQTFIPKVAHALISARLSSVTAAVQNDELDEFFSEPDLSDQLKFIPSLCRFQYASTFTFVQQRFMMLVEQYQECVQAIKSNNLNSPVVSRLPLLESQLAVLIYSIGAIISGAAIISPFVSRQEHDEIDAALCSIMFKFLPLTDFRQKTQLPITHHFDLALIFFFQQFRKTFVQQEKNSSEQKDTIYVKLSQKLGEASQNTILNLIIQKVHVCLRLWANKWSVVDSCLNFLENLALGYTSSKIMASLASSKAMLMNHTADHFPFLAIRGNEKLRTRFYSMLGRLVFTDENLDIFDSKFMQPFEAASQAINQHPNPRSEFVQHAGIGFCRDLQGILQAAGTKRAYNMVWDWLYPKHLAVIVRLLETWWDTPTVSTPVLRFMSELVDNSGKRIEFEPSSPNGILLFREASKVITTYGSRILETKQPVQDMYKERIKGISLCTDILRKCFAGEFVSFGAFIIYNDNALQNALNHVIKLLFSASLSQLLSFRKVSNVYFTFLEVLFRNHTDLVAETDSKIFRTLFGSLLEGLQSYDPQLSTQCASAIEHVCTWRFFQSKKRVKSQALKRLEMHLDPEDSRQLCEKMTRTLFNMVLFDNIQNQWSLSRPLFGLLVTESGVLKKYQQYFAAIQNPEVRPRLAAVFENLTAGIKPDLDATYKEKFTQNLTLFRAEIRKFCVPPAIL